MGAYYYKSLHNNPQIRLCWLSQMVKAAVRDGASHGTLKIDGWGYTLSLSLDIRAADGRVALTLKWKDEGERHSQTIPIVRRESNLIRGSYVYYFLCPFGYKAKQLFYIGGSFRSRRSFPHLYRLQTLSRQRREIAKGSGEQPYKRYGKEYYKGKITPYGKRCKRYEENEERALLAFYSQAQKIIKK